MGTQRLGHNGRQHDASDELVAPAVRDLIAQPADDVDATAQRVLSKNVELYRRLA